MAVISKFVYFVRIINLFLLTIVEIVMISKSNFTRNVKMRDVLTLVNIMFKALLNAYNNYD